ncbi:MAG: LemA family protein [Candidatus Bipolaricaulota bacterium]
MTKWIVLGLLVVLPVALMYDRLLTMPPEFLFLLALMLTFIAAFVWRSVRRVRRLQRHTAGLHDELTAAVRRRREGAEVFIAALRKTGYSSGAHQALEEAASAVAHAEAAGLQELAKANEQLKQALLQAYQGLPPQRLEEVRQAHNALAQAEEELDLARSKYNQTAYYHNRTLRRFTYRLLSPWTKATPAEMFLIPGEERTFLQHYSMWSR